MKFAPIITIGLASLVAATPLFNKESSQENGLSKRDHSKEGAQKAKDHADKQQQTEENHRNKQNAHKSKQEEHKKHHTKTAVAPAPSFPPQYLNSTALFTSTSSPVASTSIVSTSSSAAPAPATTTPTPTSPESIVSSIASDILGLINGIIGDALGIASSIGLDISSIFGDVNGSDDSGDSDSGDSDGFGFGFGFFKRNVDLAEAREARKLDTRDDNIEEFEAALGTLVTNVLGHLVSLANGTNISLALSFSAALDL